MGVRYQQYSDPLVVGISTTLTHKALNNPVPLPSDFWQTSTTDSTDSEEQLAACDQ